MREGVNNPGIGFRDSNAFKKDARGKLQKLPHEQFMDLTTDVYDELIRRSEESKKSKGFDFISIAKLIDLPIFNFSTKH